MRYIPQIYALSASQKQSESHKKVLSYKWDRKSICNLLFNNRLHNKFWTH